MEMEDGAVVSVDGGEEAETIERVWAEYDTPAVYNVAQLAVGMNPECPEFTDDFSTNHGRFGNVHFGIGTSTILGGETQTPVHFDAMMGEATLELDGEVVLEDGSNFTFVDEEL
jgi:leucyl aminopeptidase (aminopeptidase T)